MRVPLTTVELSDSPSSVYGQINKPQSSGVFDTSAPAVGSPMPAFGTATSPAVGASSSTNVDLSGPSTQPAFGVSSTPAASTPAFGFSSTSAFGVSSTSTASTSALGFSSTPAFGSTTPSPSVFGSTPGVSFRNTQPAFGVSSTPAVVTPAVSASTTSAFGVSPTPANGANRSPSGFRPSPAFGESTPAFGSSPFAPTSSCFWPLSTPFGGQATTPVCCRCSGFGQSSFEGQRGGSRVYPYAQTPEVSEDNCNFGSSAFRSSCTRAFGYTTSQQLGKLESISAMPEYQGKCHEELRWEDYQSGDKGGATPAGQSSGGTDFNTNIKPEANPFSYPPAFSQITANPFSSSTSTNPFVPKTSTICNPGYSNSTPSFASPYSPSAPSPFGPSPSIVGPTPGFNTNNKQESKPFSYPPAFNQISANPFSSTTPFNPFAPKTSTLCTSTLFSSPFSSSAPSPTQSVVGSIPGFGAPFNSTASLVSPFGVLAPSPFGSTPAPSPSIFGLVPGVNFGNTQPATLFQSTTPSLVQTSSPFGHPAFWPATPAFGQSNSAFGQSSASGRNMFSSDPSLQSTSSFGVNHTTSSLSVPFQPAQPTQNPGGFGFLQPAGGTSSVFGQNNFGQSAQPTQNQGVFVFVPLAGGTSSIFGQTLFGQPSTNQGPSLAQPISNIYPFETPGAMHQMSVGRVGAAPLIQYETHSLPVVVGAAAADGSSLLIMDIQNFMNLKI